MDIFAATLHPLLKDAANNCVTCHGVAQAPTFSVDDVATAYNEITTQQKVDLNNPELSRVYLRPFEDRHNCGGETECDRIAADFLAAIQDWAAQAIANAPPPDPTATVVSGTATFADGMAGGAARVDDNAVALFRFEEGAGDTTMDSSGVGDPIVLDITGMEWVEGGGLRNVNGKAQASAADSQKIFDMVTASGEFTVEAWLVPDLEDQAGPARIVSYSQDTAARNFTMGQAAIYYELRNASAATDANGTPSLEADMVPVALELTHVAMTFDPVNGRRIFINGVLAVEEAAADTLAWVADQLLVLGNEVTDDRIWLGEFRLVAIHDAALTDAEIQQNFLAGIGQFVTLSFDIAGVLGAPGSIQMQAAEVDPAGYLFAKPTFVSDEASVPVKNIRISVNGTIPVAAQAFRNLDVVATATGQELSPLGSLIPVQLGADTDIFHLEFEVLGDQTGAGDPVFPASPPAPLDDVVDSDVGVRSFSQVRDTMSSLTGIAAGNGAVSADYAELRDSLPPTTAILAFGQAQQIAIHRLARTYCGEITGNAGNCDNFFGNNCEVAAGGKDLVADVLYDSFIGVNVANQPARADVTTEVVSVLDDLACANGCVGAEAEIALQASCTAVLSSAAVTVN